MDRKAMAKETLEIMKRGYYEPALNKAAGQKAKIGIKEDMERSSGAADCFPADGEKILEKFRAGAAGSQPEIRVENISTVEAIRILASEGKTDIGVLNFASAKESGRRFPEWSQRPGRESGGFQHPLPYIDSS